MTGLPAERLTTMALHPAMHVHDGTLNAPEHVVAAEPVLLGNGQWDVSFVDGGHVVCGARHPWVVEQT